MHTLVVRAVVNRLQARPELQGVIGLFVCVERGLIRPKLDDHEMVRPADLLKDFNAKVAGLYACLVVVLPHEFDALIRPTGLNIQISCDVHGGDPQRHILLLLEQE
jgi:hypothetical protein